ncbi:sensor histidine kinase N-terminal domain-containing protein [Schlegelella sp. S2-27]|uniref:histidine kinase n=1 Tax=Caldimonas mangrovi TaxID=2944811 RepID=A0ABT0YN94_9BURK|nr:sensor histidine kinase [Caldimonas mangrovi]MCM5680196.1 sensor histidine kinase N-terminal domain-containing protein [Caldimonas mangrovi]
MRFRLSLRQSLLLLLLPTIAAVTTVELWMTRRDALEAANAAYDRSLLGAIKSIDANVSTASGGLAVELPYAQFEFFQLTASGAVHFRVATVDGLVEIGSADLPPPPRPLQLGVPVFYDASYFGDAVRLGAYMRALDRPLSATGAQHLVIQVAESIQSREAFTRSFVARAAVRDSVVLLLTAVAIVAMVALGLRPLSRLAEQVRGRTATDLAPLEAQGLPADIQPLVDAINQQLERTQALVRQQRQFLDDASHQLRTPLATLRTQVDYALREPDPAQLRRTLQALSLQIDHATRGTNQLLALARTDTAALQCTGFDIGELVREVAMDLLPRARARGQDFGIDVPAGLAQAKGDRQLLREALTNLADNAIRYTPEGGEITLSAAADRLGCSVAVVDAGPGVSDDELHLLGRRFVRGSQTAAGGSGLGLAIARSIAERHGGVLQIERRESGSGLRVAVWWPRVEGQRTSPST